LHELGPASPVKKKRCVSAGAVENGRLQFVAYQSVACHDKTSEAAKTASDVSRLKVPIASCRPLSATPRCSYAMLPTKGQSVRNAMCVAEKAKRACMT